MSVMDSIEEEYQEKIDKLVAKNERLSQELNGASEMCGGLQAIREQLVAENERLRKEIETAKFRGAYWLTQIKELKGFCR